jgi:hypothetical protein
MVAPAATQPDLCQAEPHARGTRPKRQRLSSHSGRSCECPNSLSDALFN